MSVKQRLYPDEQQVKVLTEHCGQVRFVYNNGLAKRQALTDEDRKNGIRVNFTTQCKDLAVLRQELDWLGAGSSAVQQGALRDLDRAFKNFFKGRADYPVFKKRKQNLVQFPNLSRGHHGLRVFAVVVPRKRDMMPLDTTGRDFEDQINILCLGQGSVPPAGLPEVAMRSIAPRRGGS